MCPFFNLFALSFGEHGKPPKHYGPQRDPKQELDTAEKPELLALGANGMILLLVPQTHPL
jgi:hypothetical protein